MKNLRIFGTNAFTWVVVWFSFALCCSLNSIAQELPPVLTFSPKDYQADNQNWSLTQGSEDHIYIANNKGLLEYDGESWILYPSPNQSILRSVYYHNKKVYTGSFREFGYWEKRESGDLKYHSLSEKILDSIRTDEQFWNIERLENWIIFQSLDHIYTFEIETEHLTKISIEGSISKMYKLGSDLYFQVVNQGLFKIVDGKPVLVSNASIFRTNFITNLYLVNNQILVQTDTQGIFTLEKIPQVWPSTSSLIPNYTVYASLQRRDGSIVLGTISKGVVFLDKKGGIETHITQSETLSNNTVLSILEDEDANIWLGLDNGVNCINVNSSISVFNDDNGVLGTVYASLVKDQTLYLGTNQGLFYKSLDEANSKFQILPGSNGQVWTLEEVDGVLLCGHNNGSFIFSKDEFRQISSLLGTWCFKTIPDHPNLLLQGNYNGLSVLEKTSDGWSLRNKLENFDVSSKFVEFILPNEVLIDHEYKGVYKVTINDSFTDVEDIHQYKSLDKGLYSSLVKYKHSVYYAQKEGVWKYNLEQNEFFQDSALSQLYSEDSYSSGKLEITDGEIGLWSFNKNSIDVTLQGKLNDDFRIASIPITSDSRATMAGYENVYKLDESRYLMGSTQGYAIIDYEKFLSQTIDKTLNINRVKFWENGKEPDLLSLGTDHELKNKTNNIHFSFSIPNFEKYFASEYQYKLKGFVDEWSTWSRESDAVFNNLPFGQYEFLVRARIGEKYETDLQSFHFTIKRPFAFSNLMLFLYVVALVVLIFIIHNAYKRYYRKQKLELQRQANREIELKALESEQALMKVKNEKLKQDIDSKSRELAVSTMSLIKKNEFLNSIKDELQKAKPLSTSARRVIKIIDKNINNTDDWKMFEEAFNNSDKDFLKTMKSKHPSLTPNDLRLCAYLRLNLSSKEIAPLFNISTKSVEVKRYRLRKKMDLPREIGLTDYILEI